MKKLLIAYSLIIFYILPAHAQSWHLLSNSPAQSFRHDDVYFTNASTGWVVNVSGQVWKTADGGNTWTKLIQQPTAFRCVGFFDSAHGCIGNLGPGNWAPTNDTNPLYVTSNGAQTLAPATIIGPKPKGICGLCVVNDTTIVACGRFDGPPYFLKSTDRGNTWYSRKMNTYAGMLIDPYFISPDTGFVVGGTDSIESISHSVILYTTNGGATWATKIIGAAAGNHCWKFCHPSQQVFYVSVEELHESDTLKYFKSIDGGSTWKENVIAGTPYGWSQGIGFVNDSVGWIGGDTYALSTTNGGKTFTAVSPATLLVNLNRMRFINDTLAYAVGQRVYKYDNSPSAIKKFAGFKAYSLQQNTPNPFFNTTTVTYSIPITCPVLIQVFDAGGRYIKTLVNATLHPGTYCTTFTLPHAGNGVFICSMISGLYGKRIKMISVK